MTAAEVLAILETQLPPGTLNGVKEVVFCGAWEGMAYGAIAEAAGYDADYIRESGSSLWRSLSELLQQKVTKRNFRALLLQRLLPTGPELQVIQAGAAPLPKPLVAIPSPLPGRDWGQAPDVSRFYGRQAELGQLEQWLGEESGCRVIALLGLGGVGKTLLAVKAAQQFQAGFQFVLWRSLRNPLPLSHLLREVLTHFSNHAQLNGNFQDLLKLLRQNRCLLVLDNLEALMQPGQVNAYCSGFEDYGEFLRLWADTSHRSCLLLASQDKPPLLLAGPEVKILPLGGEPGLARALLQEQKIQGSEADQEQLCRAYGHHPLAIKLVATSIQSLFGGEIQAFLQEGVLAFDGLQRLLAQQMQRLSSEEELVLVWLAIHRTGATLGTIYREMVPLIPKGHLLSLLESLMGRSLVERQAGRYSLQPVVMDYVLEQLIEQLFRELGQGELSQWLQRSSRQPQFVAPLPRLYTHALLKTTAQEHVRQRQLQLIFAPLTQRLQQILRSPQHQFDYLQELLDRIRPNGIAASGYICANLLDLALYARLNITGLNCSQVTVRQADLRHAQLAQIDFSTAEFLDCAFTQVFGTVFSLDYSPNGQLLAMGDSQGHLHLWQLQPHHQHHQLIATCPGHRGRIHALCFSPDGQLLASGADDGMVRLWDTETWACLATLVGHSRFVWSLAWNPDGTLLASGGGDRSVCLWDVETCDRLKVIESTSSWIQAVAFSPDGSLLATGSDDCALRLWDIPSGQYLGVLLGHDRWVCDLAFSPDGRWLASASHDRTIRLWDTDSGDCLQVLRGHGGLVRSLTFSGDSRLLVSTSSDQTLRLWELEQFQCLRILTGHVGWVQDAVFSPDGQQVISGGHDQTLRIWEVATGTCLDLQQGYVASVRTVAWNHNGTALATCGSDHALRLWDLELAQARKLPDPEESGLWIGCWSPDGKLLATGSKDHRVRLWDAATGQLHHRLQGHTCWVSSLCFNPQGTLLASGGSDATLRFWDPITGQCLRLLEGHSGRICSLNFSPDGKCLASAGADHSIRLWDALTGKYLRPLQGHSDLVTTVRISPDGQWLTSGSLDHSLRLWELATGQCHAILHTHSSITGMAWNGAGPGLQLATSSIQGQVQLWQVSQLLTWLQAQPTPTTPLSLDCNNLPSALGGLCQCLTAAGQSIWDVAFSPGGDRLASAGDDGITRIWDLRSGKCIQQLSATGPYDRMKIRGVRGLSQAQIQSLQQLGALID